VSDIVTIKRSKGITAIHIGNELIITNKLNRYKIRKLEKYTEALTYSRKKFKSILDTYLNTHK